MDEQDQIYYGDYEQQQQHHVDHDHEGGDCCMCSYNVVIASIIVAFIVLYFLKKHFSGGTCNITKNLSNQIAVITGGNTGIGKQTARRLVQLGCKVIIGARDTEKNQKAVDELNSLKKGEAYAFNLDLESKQSILDFVSKTKEVLEGKPINYLINNAGIMFIPQLTLTEIGVQQQMGVNHFGHFLLTYYLWPEIQAAKNPRIVNVSSLAHIRNKTPDFIKFDDFAFDQDTYIPRSAYSRSKKANVLFTKQLQRRMDEANINGISVSLHPGVVRTQLGRQLLNNPIKKGLFLIFLGPLTYIFMKSSTQGAQTTLYTLLEDQDKLQKGNYYADCKAAKIRTSQCRDPQAAKKLWQATENIWGVKFEIK